MKKNHYVYIIFNKTTFIEDDKQSVYIGVRSCDCEPEEDINYMSSSKYLKEDIKQNGKENFSKQIMWCFNNRKEAVEYEIELHNLYNVAVDKTYYNRTKQTATGFDTSGSALTMEHKIKCSLSLKGRIFSKEHKQKMSEAGKGRIFSDETRQKMSEAKKNISDETRQKIREAVKRRICSDETRQKLSEAGKGRICSDETRQKLREAKKNISDETRQKLSESHKNKPKIKCPHCNREYYKNNFNRWHGDKCKQNNNIEGIQI